MKVMISFCNKRQSFLTIRCCHAGSCKKITVAQTNSAYIYMCVCVCVFTELYIYIYIYIYLFLFTWLYINHPSSHLIKKKTEKKKKQKSQEFHIIWLSKWEVGFYWLSIKFVSNTLPCCCFVCVFIIGQYHSGNNKSSISGAAGEILIFECEKCHRIWPLKLKTDTLTVSAFDAFIHVWWIKTLPQSPICTEEILFYTVHITSIIIKFWFWS